MKVFIDTNVIFATEEGNKPRAEGFGEKVEAPHYSKEGSGWLR